MKEVCSLILFDQRGYGQSEPFASLDDNTTWHLLDDIEALRVHLGIDRWQVFCGSWGSTLGVAYAEAHPARVTELILRGIFMFTDGEGEWFYGRGTRILFPDAWDAFVAVIPPAERGDLIAAYYKRLTSQDPDVQATAARAWSLWESRVATLLPDAAAIAHCDDRNFTSAFSRIECHYFFHRGFLQHERQLLIGGPVLGPLRRRRLLLLLLVSAMSIPLEDLFNDVLGKSQRGLGFTVETLAEKAGVTVAQVAAVKDGTPDHATLLRLAPALGLHGPSLVAMSDGGWTPAEVAVDGLAQFTTTYHDMTVNAYLVWDAQTREAAAFDTGADAAPMVVHIRKLGLTLKYLFLTHTHPDHVADIPTLAAPTVLSSERESHPSAQTFAPGTIWQLGGLTIESRSTWGHSKGGTTFVVRGLSQPVAVVGDALFASSMGGGAVSFPDAVATNRKEIFTLPDEAVIAPGHGPLTTVGEEKAPNPFYPEFK